MYVTEAMIASMEDMQNNAQAMESHIKGMIETEARMHGMELDARRNARDMWNELSKHMANLPAEIAAAAAAPVAPEHAVADSPHAAPVEPEHVEEMDDEPAPEGTDPMPEGTESVEESRAEADDGDLQEINTAGTASSLEEAMDDDTGSDAKS